MVLPRLAGLVLVIAKVSATWYPPPVVTVSGGVISGLTTCMTLATAPTVTATVNKYVGVPFASSPPVRFQAPQPVPAWTSTFQAIATAPACVQKIRPIVEQLVFNNPDGPFPPESEDCLYLNIYVPQNATKTSGLAVMFWIFGGDFGSGDGSLLRYDGTSFAANQNVIVVTINYRTNIFGFSMAPVIPLAQRNTGLLDQRFALNWIYQNIAAFGGNPNKITIFGESSGGFAVEQLIAYPPSPVQFRAAILQSRSFNSPGNGTTAWTNALQNCGCDTASDQLGCMRLIPAIAMKNLTSNITFGPVEDYVTFTADVRPRLAPLGSGAVNVPVILGTNGQEGTVFAHLLNLENPTANLTTALQILFRNNTFVNQILSVITDIGDVPKDTEANVVTDVAFTCTTSLLANNFQNAGMDVYRYYYNASFPETNIFPGAGAYHSSELPVVFGTYPVPSNAFGSVTPAERATSNWMQTAWANFAKDPYSQPQPSWPQLGVLGNVQNIGSNGRTDGTNMLAGRVDYVCGGYDVLLSLNGY